ncbi:MFS transporter [Pseudogemmobacter sonorensis]|uniref:MFS transporter n=1 Tax=Pseudogemmobacter sonorensis TaxID=2989681 RepID=UPI0036C795F8
MTTTTLPPSQTTETPEHEISPSEISVGVVIGRTAEFFDFFVYSIASVIVFPSHVFPFVDPLTGTLLSFLVFALAFVARPLGTLLFSWIDGQYGRVTRLTIALFGLGGATAAIALLPGYETVGMASVAILASFRLAQGLALGGTWDGLPSLLAMSAPPGRRGLYAMVPQLGAPFGLIVAAALFIYLLTSLSAQDFLAWGWRYPFFVALAINVVALFARLRIVATPEYDLLFRSRELQPTPVLETIRAEGRNIVIGAFAPLASFAMFHMVTVYPLSWIFLFTEADPARFLIITVIAALFGAVAVVVSGLLSDAFGRTAVLAWGAGMIGMFSLFAPVLLDGGGAGETVYMIAGFVILGLSFGQASGAVAANLAPGHRYTASALTSDLAWLFGAGFAPAAALLLSSWAGLWTGGAYLLSGALATLLALWLGRFRADHWKA